MVIGWSGMVSLYLAMKSQAKYSKSLFNILGVVGIFIIMGTVAHQKSCSVSAFECRRESKPEIQASMQLAPRYITYTPQSLADAQTKGKVILYFWAPWCSSCTSLDLDLQQGSQVVPQGLTILRLEYGKHPDLEKKYDVTVQHTFVQINEKEEKLGLWVGGEIEDFKKHLL